MPISTSEVNAAAYARNGDELRKLNYETTGGQVKLTEQNGVTQADAQAEFEAIHGLVGAAQSTADDALSKAEQAIDSIPDPYTLPVASTETLGGIKPDGVTVTVSPDGTAAVPGSTPPDGTTIVSKDSKLVAQDIAIDGDPSDLASARGQIGDVGYLSTSTDAVDIDDVQHIPSGLFRVYKGTVGTWPPIGNRKFMLDHIRRYSDGVGIYHQTLREVTNGALFCRGLWDSSSQPSLGGWNRLVDTNTGVGDGINVGSNGVISVPEMQGATASESGVAGLVPPAGAGVDNRFLSPFGDWRHGTTREILTANKTLYVRADGNDSNDGSADDAEHAFRTIAGALEYAHRRYAVASKSAAKVSLKVGFGEFSARINSTFVRNFVLEIVGSGKDSTNIILEGGVYIMNDEGSPRLKLGDTKISAELSAEILWQGKPGTITVFENVAFDVVASGQNFFHAYLPHSSLWLRGANSINITGNAGSIFYAVNSGAVLQGSLEVNGDFDTFASLSNASMLYSSAVFSGVSTGMRYKVESGSVLNTRGNGPDYLPGSKSGIVDESSHYI